MFINNGTTEAEFLRSFEKTNIRPTDPVQRELALKWHRGRGTFKATTAIPQATSEPSHVTTASSPAPEAPAVDPPAALIATTEQAWAWLKRHWDDGDVIGIARLHNILDSEHERTVRGALQWGNAKSLKFTVGHDERPIADVSDVLDIPATALPWRIQSRYPTATGALLVARYYRAGPAGQAALAAVLEGRRTGMSYTGRYGRDDDTFEGGERVKTLLQSVVSEFCDSDRPAQHPTFAMIREIDFLGPNGLYQWQLS